MFSIDLMLQVTVEDKEGQPFSQQAVSAHSKFSALQLSAIVVNIFKMMVF